MATTLAKARMELGAAQYLLGGGADRRCHCYHLSSALMIETMFALSVAHVSHGTAAIWLRPSKDVTAFPRGDDGWFVRVPDSDPQDLPLDLAECFALARGSGCDWITFDPQAEPLSILKVQT